MKKTLILMMTAFVAVLAACKKDDKAIVSSNIVAPVISTPATATSYTVTGADSTQNIKFSWSSANYGPPAVITYFVQIDTTGRNFAKKITIGTVSSVDSLSMTLGTLNTKITGGLKLAPNVPSTIDVRVGSAVYGKDTVYSNPIKLTVTTYKQIAPVKLWIPGSYQGYSPGTAPTIPFVTTFTYEGYIYISASGDIKFTSAPDYNHVNYGFANAGVLTTNGLAGGIPIPAAGVYKLNADINALTYSAVLINSFGVIGTATPQQWNASTPMTYNQARNVWTITLALVPGALKFRANDDWGINYGPSNTNALTGSLIQTNDAITINVAGNYTVTMDMSGGVNNYNYTVVKN